MLVHLLVAGEIRHATRAQIIAALPPVLRVQDAPDPQGEARYARVIALARRAYSPEIAKGEDKSADAGARHRAAVVGRSLLIALERALDGRLRVPAKGGERFPEFASLRSLAKLARLSVWEAAERGDRGGAARWATLGLRLSDSLMHAGGTTIFVIVAVSTEATAERSIVEADAKHAFSEQTRRSLLSLLPPIRGPLSELAPAVRREFYEEWMPLLVDPIHGYEAVLDPKHWPDRARERPMAGNYDPVETAKLFGRIFTATMEDCRRSRAGRTGTSERLARAAGKGLPNPSNMKEAPYRAMMDSIPNSIGRAYAAVVSFDLVPVAGDLRAARRNLARAAILLRHGEYTPLPDPFGKGPLKIDAKRRIVYSVGENGKDDGGQIGKGFRADAPDFGYRY